MPATLPPALVAAVRAAGEALPGAAAAFDADGTLWREDVGEAFLHHLIARGLVRLPGGRDPYAAYEERVARDRATGYAYAAQLLAGLGVDQVESEAAAFAQGWVGPRLIASTQALLALCRECGLVPAVVSASAIQIVRAAAPLAGVPVERCAGMTVSERGGLFTEELIAPVTYAAGKVEALAKAGWLPAAVAGGDSLTGDLAMLAAARVAVVVAPAQGSPLADEGARRAWFTLPQE